MKKISIVCDVCDKVINDNVTDKQDEPTKDIITERSNKLILKIHADDICPNCLDYLNTHLGYHLIGIKSYASEHKPAPTPKPIASSQA